MKNELATHIKVRVSSVRQDARHIVVTLIPLASSERQIRQAHTAWPVNRAIHVDAANKQGSSQHQRPQGGGSGTLTFQWRSCCDPQSLICVRQTRRSCCSSCTSSIHRRCPLNQTDKHTVTKTTTAHTQRNTGEPTASSIGTVVGHQEVPVDCVCSRH